MRSLWRVEEAFTGGVLMFVAAKRWRYALLMLFHFTHTRAHPAHSKAISVTRMAATTRNKYTKKKTQLETNKNLIPDIQVITVLTSILSANV
jgi:hypothetical protein